jgi:hypothetical protein
VKLRPKPYAVYLARLKPSAGMEALWAENKNDRLMRAHPGSFPDITVNIDPEGSMAMKDQHFPIFSTGMADATVRIRTALELADKGKVQIRKVADQEVGGTAYPCVEIDAQKLGGRKVPAKEDETLFDVARRTGSAPYLLYRYNPDIDDLDDSLDAGQAVFIPAYYAKRTEFCFDPATKIFVRENYYDTTSLFERYDSLERKINVGLTDADFDSNNAAYDF